MLLVVRGLGDFVWLWLQVYIEITADRGREGREQAVVIGLRDRIELVIVAASAADGQPEHRTARRRRHVIERVVARSLNFIRRDLRRKNPRAEKACGLESQRILRLEFVACQLPA